LLFGSYLVIELFGAWVLIGVLVYCCIVRLDPYWGLGFVLSYWVLMGCMELLGSYRVVGFLLGFWFLMLAIRVLMLVIRVIIGLLGSYRAIGFLLGY